MFCHILSQKRQLFVLLQPEPCASLISDGPNNVILTQKGVFLFYIIFLFRFKFCKTILLPPYHMAFGAQRHTIRRLEVLQRSNRHVVRRL
jgi:hypothetical protein